jgi:hypothetical protein
MDKAGPETKGGKGWQRNLTTWSKHFSLPDLGSVMAISVSLGSSTSETDDGYNKLRFLSNRRKLVAFSSVLACVSLVIALGFTDQGRGLHASVGRTVLDSVGRDPNQVI